RNSQSEFRVSQVNINSVKQTINMHKTMGWFGIFMAFFSCQRKAEVSPSVRNRDVMLWFRECV
ncbi:hypothetical protein U9R90_36695, partial [Streptomyces sp. E11-3]